MAATHLQPVADDTIEPCVYCGLPADSVDHVIPRAYVSQIRDTIAPLDKTLKAFGETVPACIQCNSILGASALFTMTERRSLVKERLRKKYKRLLAAPDWTHQELNDLDGTLRTHVIALQAAKDVVRARIRWPS